MDLNDSEYPYIEKPNKPVVRKSNIGLKTNMFGADQDEEDELPYLIIFVIGGICHNEICALENLNQYKKIRSQIVIGSTSIITGNDYFNQLKSLRTKEENPPNEVDLSSIELKFM